MEHVDKGHMRHDCAPQLGVGIDHCAHQLAPGRSARDADPARAGIAACDQAARDIDEIGEGVGAAFQFARLVPRPAQIVPAANMRDGISKPAVHQRKPTGREAGIDRQTIGPITIKVQRACHAINRAWAVLAHDNRDRNQSAVARRNLQSLGGVQRSIVARGDFLHLQRGQAAVRDAVIQYRGRADHAFISQPQGVHRPFGVVAQSGDIARFGEDNRLDPASSDWIIIVVAHLDLVEPAAPPFDHVEIAVEFEPRQIERVRSFDQCGPVARRCQRRSGEAEILMRVVGVDEQRLLAQINVVFHPGLTGADEDRFGERIGHWHQPHFAGFMIRSADDQPLFVSGQRRPDTEAFIVLMV